MNSETTRSKIVELLEHSYNGMTPSDISLRVSTDDNEVSESEVIEHIEHIRKSMRTEDRQLTGQPPKCQECDFEDFDRIVNIPSQCPKCRSDWILQPRFKIVES